MNSPCRRASFRKFRKSGVASIGMALAAVCAYCLLFSSQLRAQIDESILPTMYQQTWEPGIPGGIPADNDPNRPATVWLPAGNPYNGYSVNPALTGTANAAAFSSAFQAAINSAGAAATPSNRQIVLLAAGSYFVNPQSFAGGQVGIYVQADNVTIRGAGSASTSIIANGTINDYGTVILFGHRYGWGFPGGITSLSYMAYSWVKDVFADGGYSSTDPTNHPGKYGSSIGLSKCYRCEVTGSYVQGATDEDPGGQSYGIDINSGASQCLVDDNISINQNKPIIFQAAGGGNVISYNYVDQSELWDTATWLESSIDSSHSAFDHSDLFEGNWAANIGNDGTHGNSGFDVHLLNYVNGNNSIDPKSANLRAVTAGCYDSNEAFAGNVLEGGTVYEWTPSSNGSGTPIYQLGYCGGNVGWDDGYAQNNIWVNGNWDNVSNAEVWQNGSEPVPNSFYSTSAPAFFAGYTWPWVDPTTGTTQTLPAKARYASGNPVPQPGGGGGGPPAVTLSPTSLTFASQVIGTTSAAQSVTVTNSGTGNLNFGSLNFADNASNSPQAVGLSGNGINAPAVALSPTSLTFPSQVDGTTSAAQTVTVTNSGTANLTFGSGAVTISGTNAADFAITSNGCNGQTIVPKGTCSVSVTFTPSIVGSESASLNFADNANNSPQAAGLSGTGAGVPTAVLSPTSLIFASQADGTTSAAQTVTVTNSGTGNLTFASGAVTISGTNAADFGLASNGCSGQSVAPKGTCSVSVTFRPSIVGSESASLNFADNASNSPQAVSLSGPGTSGGGGGGIKYIQTVQTDFTTGGTSFTSNSITTSSGDLLVAAVSIADWQGVPDITSIQLDGTSSFTLDHDLANGTQFRTVIATLPNVPPGAHTITVNANGTMLNAVVFASEFSGVTTSSPEDGAGATASGYGTTPASGTFTTTGTYDLWVATYGGTATQSSITAGSGWTVPTNGTALGNSPQYPPSGFEYQIVSGQTSGNGSFTITNNDNWAALAVAYKSSTGAPPPDFSISASPSSQTVTAGSGTSYTATVTPSNGYTGTVTFSASGLPTGAKATFNPTSVKGSGNSTVSVSTSSRTPAGTYTVTIKGTDSTNNLMHSTTVTLVVNARK